MTFVCTECGARYEYGRLRWRCDCGAHLKLDHQPVFTREDIIPTRLNMWRYEKAYPIPYSGITVTFDEGLTPLVSARLGGAGVRVKLEGLMPSCSFKDRGTVMAVNYLKNHGADYITEDSSGNAAASIAAYCALGGLGCSIYIPEGNSSGKIMQTRAYGASVHSVPGTREDVAAAAQKHEQSYAGHNWHPMFEPGYRSIAYEIWEQSGFSAPDAVFAPCGGGGLTLGLTQGFSDLLRGGQIEKLPKIYAVQPENCNPIYRAFHSIEGEFTPTPTIAEGTSIARPVKLKEIISGVRASGGQMVSVSEEQILEALPVVWKSGTYTEPTSATAFAAYFKMQATGEVTSADDVVIVASSNGLKTTEKVKDLIERI